MKKTVVTQAPNAPEVTVEVIAQSIQSISEGVKSLRRGRLNDKALTILIHAAAKPPQKYGQKPGMGEIRSVLDALESLGAEYLKKR